MHLAESALSWKMPQCSSVIANANTKRKIRIPRSPPCVSVLGFPDNSISAGGGGGLLAGHQLLEMGNVV